MEKIRIRDKHPGSATPQNYIFNSVSMDLFFNMILEMVPRRWDERWVPDSYRVVTSMRFKLGSGSSKTMRIRICDTAWLGSCRAYVTVLLFEVRKLQILKFLSSFRYRKSANPKFFWLIRKSNINKFLPNTVLHNSVSQNSAKIILFNDFYYVGYILNKVRKSQKRLGPQIANPQRVT